MNEPSPGELARRLDEIVRLLQGLVSRPEYTEYQRHLEHRLAEVDADLAELRRTHAEDIRDIGKRLDERERTNGTNVRQAIYSGIIPAILFLVGILITISQSRGGK
ncbi:hypothetical protein ACRYCC_26250 [Actinomadura scrupuli]|uniref:hypothetical protein n=1 Tax=Actinomadura scrupuli TaxID=559629 RepID=UPI003D979E57